MNPYQVMGGIACCTLIFAGVVTFLTVQGVPLLMAFLGVYLLAIWIMMGMQRRARQLFEENSSHGYQRRDYKRDDNLDDRDVAYRSYQEEGAIESEPVLNGREHFHA